MFLDEVTISLRAGKGGDGCISFLRQKYRPNGGPNGGHGGNGGNIILRAEPNKNTLYHFKHVKQFKAENGEPGGGQDCAGRYGQDLVLDVPVGTLVLDEEGNQLADLSEPGQQFLAAAGGMGGKGNANFTSSIRQAPRFAELGEPGEEKKIHLELKLVADVGIIGLPSVGKSTLISVISAARPKIAEYPFTTLVPNLGVVSHRDETFVVTDLPGLIKGASKGKGLGHQFLKHAERVRCFIHLVRADSESPATDYRTIRAELKKYSPELAEKPEIVALSCVDRLEAKELAKVKTKLEKAIAAVAAKAGQQPSPIHLLSAPLHEGLTPVLDATLQTVQKAKAAEAAAAEPAKELPVFRPHLAEKSKRWSYKKSKGIFIIDGPRLNQIVVMSDLSNPEAMARVQDVLNKFGISRELNRAGAKAGAKLEIAGKRLEWWGRDS